MKLFYRDVLLVVATVVSVGFLSACATTSTAEKAEETGKQAVKMGGDDWVLVHPSNAQALDGNKDGKITVAEKKAVLG